MKIVSSNGHGCQFCRPPLIFEIVGKFDLGLLILRFLHANLYHLFSIYFSVKMVLICYNCELRTRCVLNFLIFSPCYWEWVGYLYP